jgi:CRP-like cAMP-binding protein
MPLKVVPRRDRKMNRLVKKARVRSLSRGEVLFGPGDPAETVFLVKEGHLQITIPRRGRHRARVVQVVGPWELGGEEGLLGGSHRRSRGLAGEGSSIVVLDGGRVNNVLRTAAKTLEAFLVAKEDELELARTLAGLRRHGGARRRLAGLLLHLAHRLGRREGEEVLLSLRLTHAVLADLSACHRSTVTTLLNDWLYRRILLDAEAGIRIREPEALQKEAGVR